MELDEKLGDVIINNIKEERGGKLSLQLELSIQHLVNMGVHTNIHTAKQFAGLYMAICSGWDDKQNLLGSISTPYDFLKIVPDIQEDIANSVGFYLLSCDESDMDALKPR